MTTVYQCAVVGQPIEHSLSPIIHARFARELGIKLDYQKKLSTDETFQQTVKEFFAKGGKGLNITLPFKEKAFELADFPSESASNSKAANTLWQDKDGKIIADNTDGVGLLSDLNRYITLKEKRVLMIGAGGAAKGVIPSLLSSGIASLHIANRTEEKATRLASDYARVTASSLGKINGHFDVIINATSASLDEKKLLISDTLFNHAFCYDMVYQNKETPFLRQALAGGASDAIYGIGMLVHQAAFSFQDWFAVFPDPAPLLASFENGEISI